MKLRGMKEWKKKCELFHKECVDYLDAFLVNGRLTGLDIERYDIDDEYVKGIQWSVTMPETSTMLQAEFIHWIGDDEVKVIIFEMAFDIDLTEEKELLDLGFDYQGEQSGYSSGEKFIVALLDMKKLEKLMSYLSGKWHYDVNF